MNIDYLRDYTELAKHLSYTEAARHLNMGQPTLSKHICQLEKDIRLTLFERVGNSLQLTKAGTALLPYAYQILDAENDFCAEVQELRRTPPPRLTISGITDEEPSTEVLGFLIALLRPLYGSNFLEVKSRFNSNPREMLEANAVDMIFDPAPREESLEGSCMESIHIANLHLIALMSRENPLAGRQNLSLDDLKYETFLKCEGIYISRSWSYIEEACRRHGFTPKTRSRHCASIAELFTLCANLGSTVLVIGCNFGNRIPAGIQQFCHTVPIEDDDATIPLYLLFRGDNANPVLREAASRIKEMPQPAISFS